MSHDLLDDLVADVPRHVVADPAAAWRAGTRRRVRTYVVEGLAVAAALAVVGLGLVLLHDRTPVQPVGPSKTVDGHPRTVPLPYLDQPLPERPGPLAGLVDVQGTWRAVAPDGHSWRLAQEVDQVPSLSDDGLRLGMLVPDGHHDAHYETIDLVTGARTRYDEFGNGSLDGDEPQTGQAWFAAPQNPAYWSPDGSALLLRGGATAEHDDTTALLLDDGTVTPLHVQGYPAGWVSPTELAWLDIDNDKGSVVEVTDLAGNVLRTVVLARRIVWATQFTPRVSPDGDRIAMLSEQVDTGEPRLWLFSLADGAAEPASPHRVVGANLGCPMTWIGDRVAVARGNEFVVPLEDGAPLVTINDRRQGVSCNTWASAALAGPAQDGPGLSEWRYWPFLWWWSWWWKQILVGLVVVLAGLGLWLLDRWDTRKHLGAT